MSDRTLPRLNLDLIISGPPGSGKTILRRLLCRILSQEDISYSVHSEGELIVAAGPLPFEVRIVEQQTHGDLA